MENSKIIIQVLTFNQLRLCLDIIKCMERNGVEDHSTSSHFAPFYPIPSIQTKAKINILID